MKKTICIVLLSALALMLFSGCSVNKSGSFETSRAISVVSREDGSGTRGAFIELFGILQKGEDGSSKDFTTKEAVIANSTSVIMTNVAGDKYAIGYISLGSLNDTVKAVHIEGIEAAAENVKNGTYPVARPFIIATKGDMSELTKDFIDFILSADGQGIVSASYISVDDNAPAYSGNKPSGKIVAAGSSSVTPVMEKLKEAYLVINPNASIEIQESDSSAGMTAAISGTCEIGMASRELKDSELKELSPIQIAIDGIAVIINNDSPVTNLTKEQVKSIYTGDTTKWSDIIK